MNISERIICPDCGPATVSHAVERWSARVDGIMGYIHKPFETVAEALGPLVSKMRPGCLAPPLATFFSAIKLGTVVSAPDEKTNLRARVLWEEAARRGIVMKEFRPFNLSRDLFFASHGGDARAFDGLPRPRSSSSTSINWMDDKGIIMEKFRAAGIPVPHGKSCKNLRQAEEVFRAVERPFIVKPAIGSRSRHTYVNITSLAALRHAFKKAQELSPFVVVQEELLGFVFRVTLVGGTVAGVVRREPPHVVGDGKHTVRELIEKENKNPLRQGPIFHELPIGGEETSKVLTAQQLSLEAIPEKGVVVVLHKKVSRAYGASTTEITDIHPDNMDSFLKIAEVLDDPLVGVDFMIEDISKSWCEQSRCGVIECNSLPFIDLHHYPLKGTARNVASMVWDLIFPESRPS